MTRPERYLIQTAHAILKYITSKERGQIYLFVINGNKNTGEEQPGDLNLISSYFDDILLSPTAMQNTRKHSSNLNMDYAKALRHCASKAPQPPYTLIIEDDALAAPFFSHVTKAIDLVQRKDEKLHDSPYLDFFTMKLYSSEFYFGWELSLGDVSLLVALAIILSTIAVTTLVVGLKKIRRSGYRPNVNLGRKKISQSYIFTEYSYIFGGFCLLHLHLTMSRKAKYISSIQYKWYS